MAQRLIINATVLGSIPIPFKDDKTKHGVEFHHSGRNVSKIVLTLIPSYPAISGITCEARKEITYTNMNKKKSYKYT